MASQGDEGGMDRVTIKGHNQGGATATIHRHGATLTSWTTAGGEELLFVSPKAVFQPPKAIRGGVPICFPQFGNLGPLKAQHGFARNKQWEVAASGGSSCTLALSSDEETLAQWPHDFRAEVAVTVLPSGALQQVFRVTNTGGEPFEFTCALHTYFRVSDVSNASVVGLKGVRYWDNAAGAEAVDAEDAVTFPGEVDRAYIGAPGMLKIRDSGRDAVLIVHKTGFADAVVWNPCEAKAAGMADLGEHWRGFVCLEVAQARSGAVVLQPGQTWEGSTTVEHDTVGEGAD